MKLGRFEVTAVELDPSKKYVFLLDRSVSPYELREFIGALNESGLHGLVWKSMEIIDFDQIKGYVEVDE